MKSCIRDLTAILLGECVIYNKSSETGKDAFAIVDAIVQKIGLTSFFMKFDEIHKSSLFSSIKPSQTHKQLTRSASAGMTEMEEVDEKEISNQENEDHLMLGSMFNVQFVEFIGKLEADIIESGIDVYSHSKSKATVVPADLQQKGGESDGDYIKRLKFCGKAVLRDTGPSWPQFNFSRRPSQKRRGRFIST